MKAFRAHIFDFKSDSTLASPKLRVYEDGLLVIENGRVKEFGDAKSLLSGFSTVQLEQVEDYRPLWLCPGFIDSHVHLPQINMMAAYGEQLLEWLQRYTFPEEQAFANKSHSKANADFFVKQLLSHGTTTAAVYASSHKHSLDDLFEQCQQRQMRMIAGQVLMDRHAPEDLLCSVEQMQEDCSELIGKWHHKDRLHYAFTPRFAPACSEELLSELGELKKQFPSCYMQTHISENTKELAWVSRLFPDSKDYLEVYERSGLIDDKSLLAHGIHLSGEELQRIKHAGACICHCPSSNLFLGSGLLALKRLIAQDFHLALGSDIGAGTSLSMLDNMADAYKIQQLQGLALQPLQLWYLASLGAAKSLKLEAFIGNFDQGKEADFIILNPKVQPLLNQRLRHCETVEEALFAMLILGGQKIVEASFILGQAQWQAQR